MITLRLTATADDHIIDQMRLASSVPECTAIVKITRNGIRPSAIKGVRTTSRKPIRTYTKPKRLSHSPKRLAYAKTDYGYNAIDIPKSLQAIGRTEEDIRNASWRSNSAEHRIKMAIARRERE